MEHNNDTFSESFDLSTGFHDHTAKIKISPWPFIATGTLTTVIVTLTSGKLITELNYNATRALTGQKYILYLPVNP